MSITCLPPPALYASAYEVERVLGSGSFGTCVLAVEVSTGRRYVLKQVALGGLSAAQREAAQREVDLLTTLLHPHVIRCYGAFTSLAQLNIVLEFADASDLSAVLSDAAALGERLSEGRIMTWWAQLASAVAFCHSHRILHRDLKSANVLLSRVATGEIVVKLAGEVGGVTLAHGEERISGACLLASPRGAHLSPLPHLTPCKERTFRPCLAPPSLTPCAPQTLASAAS